MIRHFFFCLFMVSTPALFGQKYLDGLWEGTLTLKDRTYKFEILFKTLGKGRIKGKTYIYESEKDVIEADIKGRFHKDRSMNLYDLEVNYAGPSEWLDVFRKNYQLVVTRSVFGSTLEGYWQEQNQLPTGKKSKQGRIFLKRAAEQPDKA